MNNQKPLKLAQPHPSGNLIVHSIFPTIQGEGIYAGHPATFIRLAGCNLRCPSCDTDYTSDCEMTVTEILNSVHAETAPNKLVVITGGEPFRQHVQKLLEGLTKCGYTVQIETNGTLPPTFDPMRFETSKVKIVCSPKGKINNELAPFIDAYKYVVGYLDVDFLDGLPNSVLGLKIRPSRPHPKYPRPVFIQPMDSKDAELNSKHLQAAIKSSLDYGYTLCLQIHKIIDVE